MAQHDLKPTSSRSNEDTKPVVVEAVHIEKQQQEHPIIISREDSDNKDDPLVRNSPRIIFFFLIWLTHGFFFSLQNWPYWQKVYITGLVSILSFTGQCK